MSRYFIEVADGYVAPFEWKAEVQSRGITTSTTLLAEGWGSTPQAAVEAAMAVWRGDPDPLTPPYPTVEQGNDHAGAPWEAH